jgi:hypothetical protein
MLATCHAMQCRDNTRCKTSIHAAQRRAAYGHTPRTLTHTQFISWDHGQREGQLAQSVIAYCQQPVAHHLPKMQHCHMHAVPTQDHLLRHLPSPGDPKANANCARIRHCSRCDSFGGHLKTKRAQTYSWLIERKMHRADMHENTQDQQQPNSVRCGEESGACACRFLSSQTQSCKLPPPCNKSCCSRHQGDSALATAATAFHIPRRATATPTAVALPL